MTHRIRQTFVYPFLVASVPWLGSVSPGFTEKPVAAAIQVIADITAIQASCWDLDVRPGVAFRYGESHGVKMVDVLPGGRRRDEFDAAFVRSSMIDRSELCSSLAAKYAAELPGVLDRR